MTSTRPRYDHECAISVEMLFWLPPVVSLRHSDVGDHVTAMFCAIIVPSVPYQYLLGMGEPDGPGAEVDVMKLSSTCIRKSTNVCVPGCQPSLV